MTFLVASTLKDTRQGIVAFMTRVLIELVIVPAPGYLPTPDLSVCIGIMNLEFIQKAVFINHREAFDRSSLR